MDITLFSSLAFYLIAGVLDIIKLLFPPVPYPDFNPVYNVDGFYLDTADVPDWSVIYMTVAQPLDKAIIWVCNIKCIDQINFFKINVLVDT